MTIDRRRFLTAAGVGAELLSTSQHTQAQTGISAGTPRPLPPDKGLFPGFDAKWVQTNGADILFRSDIADTLLKRCGLGAEVGE